MYGPSGPAESNTIRAPWTVAVGLDRPDLVGSGQQMVDDLVFVVDEQRAIRRPIDGFLKCDVVGDPMAPGAVGVDDRSSRSAARSRRHRRPRCRHDALRAGTSGSNPVNAIIVPSGDRTGPPSIAISIGSFR
jgi:hypothetical protein